jgi:methyl-accepting chemotaxis protein
MTTKDEINRAIAAHSAWKHRLATAIATGTDGSTPDKVRLDNLCDFGKWLYSADPGTKGDRHYGEVKALHAAFQVAASEVLALALTGRTAEAQKASASGSPFMTASVKITTAMVAWSNSLGA